MHRGPSLKYLLWPFAPKDICCKWTMQTLPCICSRGRGSTFCILCSHFPHKFFTPSALVPCFLGIGQAPSSVMRGNPPHIACQSHSVSYTRRQLPHIACVTISPSNHSFLFPQFLPQFDRTTPSFSKQRRKIYPPKHMQICLPARLCCAISSLNACVTSL